MYSPNEFLFVKSSHSKIVLCSCLWKNLTPKHRKLLNYQFSDNPPWLIDPANVVKLFANCTKSSTDTTINQLFQKKAINFADYAKIYSDGFSFEKGKGCTVIHHDKTFKCNLYDVCSIFFCEAHVIKIDFRIIEIDVATKRMLHSFWNRNRKPGLIRNQCNWTYIVVL